jgi:hypothetical protein
MIATDERTAPEERTVLEATAGHPTEARTWLTERITTETSVLLAAAWYVLFMIGSALEPEATGSTPGWMNTLSFVFLGGLVVMVGGLIARRRWGLLASLATAGLFTAFSVACPISGHHGLAAWWFGQMACALGLVAASGYALTRARA